MDRPILNSCYQRFNHFAAQVEGWPAM